MLDLAAKMLRNEIEKLYIGKCTVYLQQEVTNPVTKLTNFEEVKLVENQPCYLSHGSLPTAEKTEGPANINQTIKLFIAPELEIPPGCKITITQNGQANDYARSGKPAIYGSHQEIPLELFERYA